MAMGAAVVVGCGRREGLAGPVEAPGIARRPRADGLAWSGETLGRLVAEGLELRGADGASRGLIPIPAGRGLAAVSGGFAVLARGAAGMELHRVGLDGTSAAEPSWVPVEEAAVQVTADPKDAQAVWVVGSSLQSAFRHAPGPTRPALREVALDNRARGDVVVLADGALLLADTTGLRRIGPDGAVSRAPWRPPAPVERLCPLAAPDQILALDVAGGLHLVALGEASARWSQSLGGQGMALAADARGISALTGARQGGGTPRWTLHQLDASGAVQWQRSGEGEPGRWLALGPAVALGDAAQLQLRARDTGDEISL